MPPWICLPLAVGLAGQRLKPAASKPRPRPISQEQHRALHAVFLDPQVQARTLGAVFPNPREVLNAMVAQDQAQRKNPGAVVEVIGTDEVTSLRLLSLRLSGQVRREFHPMDTWGQRELYAFMHQDPSHPAPVLIIPPLAGAPSVSPADAWKR